MGSLASSDTAIGRSCARGGSQPGEHVEPLIPRDGLTIGNDKGRAIDSEGALSVWIWPVYDILTTQSMITRLTA